MMFISDHPNAKLLEKIYRRSPESLELLRGRTDSQFVCHGTGENAIAGDFVGSEEFLAHLALMDQLCDGTLIHTPVSIYADDTWAIVPATMTASRNGRSLDMEVAGIWRFSGPELLAEHWEVSTDRSAWDDFWA